MPDITLYMAVNTYAIGFMFTMAFCYGVDLNLLKDGEQKISKKAAHLLFSSLWFVTLPMILFFMGRISINRYNGKFPDDY